MVDIAEGNSTAVRGWGRHPACTTRHLAEVGITVRAAATRKRRPPPSTARYPAVQRGPLPRSVAGPGRRARDSPATANGVVAAVTLAIAQVPHPVTVPSQTMTEQTHSRAAR
jgi:hypothetical protein